MVLPKIDMNKVNTRNGANGGQPLARSVEPSSGINIAKAHASAFKTVKKNADAQSSLAIDQPQELSAMKSSGIDVHKSVEIGNIKNVSSLPSLK